TPAPHRRVTNAPVVIEPRESWNQGSESPPLIPAKAGTHFELQAGQAVLDSRLRGKERIWDRRYTSDTHISGRLSKLSPSHFFCSGPIVPFSFCSARNMLSSARSPALPFFTAHAG